MKSFIRNLIHKLFCLLQINNNVITFESYAGKNFSCNCKAIFDEIQAQSLGYICKIFINKGVKLEDKYKKHIVYRGTIKWIYYTAISKYWIKNTGAYGGLSKRKGQIYINTWHSGGILKKQGYDLENVPLEKRIPLDNVKDWDWFVAGNEEKAVIFSNSSGYKGNTIVLGMPRIDCLINFSKVEVDNIKSKLNIPKNKKVILYAPTYRDNDKLGKNNHKALNGIKIPKDYILLIRFHYYNEKKIINGKNIINVSDYNDINDLYLISDILITDYSSVVFDYSNLKRPVILYAYDLDYYKLARDFYIDYEKEMSGPIVKNIEELNKVLANIEKFNNQYKKKRERFYKRFCSMNDGQASKRFVELLVSNYFVEGVNR